MSVPGLAGGGLAGADFAGAADALATATAALAFVARAEVASLPTAIQAGLLRELERAESAHTAARARVLGAFAGQQGYEDDGHQGARSWLMWQTRISRGAAVGAAGWSRRLAAHPLVADALAEGQVSASWARQICDWSELMPAGLRGDADQILLAAAASGATLADLSGLAEEMYRRSAPPDGESDADGGSAGDEGFGDRSLQLELHFRGAGKLTGDLTPECAAALAAVLDSVGRKAGPEDERTTPQRHHDALEEACRRLISTRCLPDVAGQPTQIQLHMTLDQLRSLAGGAALERDWAAGQARAAGRAAGDGQPGWTASRAAALAYACDAQIAPMVTGCLDSAALAEAVHAFLAGTRAGAPLPPVTLDRLTSTLLRHATQMLSGPGGLASFLRTGLAGPLAAGVSLPLDLGAPTATIPPHLRRALIERDRHCAFPGCTQPPAACHGHHLIPRSRGGATALHNLALLCSFHHLIAVHRWGWTLQLNADGTTTAISPDHARTLHGHGPPQSSAA